MKNQAIKYTVAADGTSLAYQAHGTGPALLFTNGYATSTFYWEPLLGRLKKRGRLVTWDLKGHGRSAPARDLASVSVPGCADDLQRVMDAAGVEKATLFGFSFGSQIVLEAWRHFPERIEAIVSVLGPYERPFDTLMHPTVGKAAFEMFRRIGPRSARAMLRSGSLSARLPGSHAVARRMGFVCSTVTADHMRPFYEHLTSIDPATWLAMGRAAQEHSAEDLLPEIEVPVLVIAGGRDTFSPGDVGHRMVERIPTSELVYLEEATHTGLLGHPEPIGDAVERFLKRRVPSFAERRPSSKVKAPRAVIEEV